MRVSYGDDKEAFKFLGKSTSYIERFHLTSRHFNIRSSRKTLAFSKVIAMHKAAATLEDVYCNFIRSHKSSRLEVNHTDRRWEPRTPAMVSDLPDHIRSVNNYFCVYLSLGLATLNMESTGEAIQRVTALEEGIDDIVTNLLNPTNWLLESGPYYDGQDQENRHFQQPGRLRVAI